MDAYQVLETVLGALHILFGSCVKTHITKSSILLCAMQWHSERSQCYAAIVTV